MLVDNLNLHAEILTSNEVNDLRNVFIRTTVGAKIARYKLVTEYSECDMTVWLINPWIGILKKITVWWDQKMIFRDANMYFLRNCKW